MNRLPHHLSELSCDHELSTLHRQGLDHQDFTTYRGPSEAVCSANDVSGYPRRVDI